MTHQVVLLGGGGHASDILGAIEEIPSLRAVGFLDDREPHAQIERFANSKLPYLGTIASLANVGTEVTYIIAVGYPAGRRALWERVRDNDHRATRLLHPGADVGPHVETGSGVVVLAGARVSPGARLGDHTHLSYLAAVGHDTVIGDFTTVMPGAIVSGDVQVGSGVLIGTNATVLEGLAIGDGAQVAAGAVVVKDVSAHCTVAGIPAQPLRSASDRSHDA